MNEYDELTEVVTVIAVMLAICVIFVGVLSYKVCTFNTRIASLEATVIGLQTTVKPTDLVSPTGTPVVTP